MTAFAPCLIAQIGALGEEPAAVALIALSKLSSELERHCYTFCSRCEVELCVESGAIANICADCGSYTFIHEASRHDLYIPHGPLAEPKPWPFIAAPLSRPSALAERSLVSMTATAALR